MTIDEVISAANGSEEFKLAVRRYAQGQPTDRIQTVRHSPRIKVVRLMAQLLAEEPDLEIERVVVDAWSGCSDFRGTLAVSTPEGVRTFRFCWDCSWRAEQEGWYDAFDLPDQIRAAREFGWRCFETWREVGDDWCVAHESSHERR